MKFRLAVAAVGTVFLVTGGSIYGSQQLAPRDLSSPPSLGMDEKIIALPAMAEQPEVADPKTIVSLTFDDGWDDQLDALPKMHEHGMPGTFYVSSGLIGMEGYLGMAELEAIANGGHEIAGHTVTHADLTDLSLEAAKLQACASRATLAQWGYQVTSFAYPFATHTPELQQVIADCGYNSARGLGDIQTRFDCFDCPSAEKIPPAQPYYTAAPSQVTPEWTLADLQAAVTNAESTGGGWVQLTFHHMCPVAGCSTTGVEQKLFEDFLDWLAPRAQAQGTVVRTVDDVIGGEVKPIVEVTEFTPSPPAPGQNGVLNAGFEERSENGASTCWMQGAYGNNAAGFTWGEGRTGSGVTVAMSGHRDGDAKVVQTQDLGLCSPAVASGHSYSLRAWYRSTTQTQFTVYRRDGDGRWSLWTYSPYFPATEDFSQAIWQTPEMPWGTTAISFGLTIFENGTMTVDDYAMYDTDGAPAP
jgi:hypothetical protein